MEQKVTDTLVWIVKILQTYDVPYQISGGVAARFYGATRPINDIDIDMSHEGFAKILEDVKPYVTFGPAVYKDTKWDTYALQLNYHHQDIDFSQSDETYMFDEESKQWIPSFADLSSPTIIPFNGLELKVCPREKLIAYKKHLPGAHQEQDIKEISKNISS